MLKYTEVIMQTRCDMYSVYFQAENWEVCGETYWTLVVLEVAFGVFHKSNILMSLF